MNKKTIYGILTVIWIAIIFSFSLQVADRSTVLSDGVGELILENGSSQMLEESNLWSEAEWKLFHKIIRKCGHFAEFFILGMLMMMTMKQTGFYCKKWICFFLCVIVASIDETIQLFVPSRAGMITDVILDTCGSIVGMFTCRMICKLWRNRSGTVKRIYLLPTRDSKR